MKASRGPEGSAEGPVAADAGARTQRFSPVGAGLLSFRARVPAENVAWLRYVLEAEDGLAFMHSDGSGVVLLLCPEGRAHEMHALMQDLLADGCLTELLPEPEACPDERGPDVI